MPDDDCDSRYWEYSRWDPSHCFSQKAIQPEGKVRYPDQHEAWEARATSVLEQCKKDFSFADEREEAQKLLAHAVKLKLGFRDKNISRASTPVRVSLAFTTCYGDDYR